jgi:hypothetical protein
VWSHTVTSRFCVCRRPHTHTPTNKHTHTHTSNFKVRHSISSEQFRIFYLEPEAKTQCLETVATRKEIQTRNKEQERKHRQCVDLLYADLTRSGAVYSFSWRQCKQSQPGGRVLHSRRLVACQVSDLTVEYALRDKGIPFYLKQHSTRSFIFCRARNVC